MGALTALVVVSVASAIIGPDASAALRGAGTLLGPLSVVMAAVPLAVVPDTSRSERGSEATWAALRRIGWMLSGLALTVGLVAAVLPDSLGTVLLGATWTVAAPLLPITGLEYAGLAWVSVTYTLLRALGRSSALLKARCVHSALSLGLALTAAALWGTAAAVACALVVTAFVVAVGIRPLAGLPLRARLWRGRRRINAANVQ
jgi:O-antigen/teichoic acid export membrane protein